MHSMKLNLGCGARYVEGWVNVDYSFGARFAKVPFFSRVNKKLGLFDIDWDKRIVLHDLTTGFPWIDGSADVIYTSHTLEHLTKEHGHSFLEECYRVLRKDGIIRILVPDLKYLIDEYSNGNLHAEDVVERLGVLPGNNTNALKNRLSFLIQFPHKCMYDASRLSTLLGEIGFRVKGMNPFVSDIGDIDRIELQDRTENAVIVEGRKI